MSEKKKATISKAGAAAEAAFDAAAEEHGTRVLVDTGFWTPTEIGETLWGVIQSIHQPAPGAKVQRPIMRVQTDDAELVPVGMSLQMQSLLPDHSMLPGRRIGICFVGTEDVGKSSEMKVFKIALSG